MRGVFYEHRQALAVGSATAEQDDVRRETVWTGGLVGVGDVVETELEGGRGGGHGS